MTYVDDDSNVCFVQLVVKAYREKDDDNFKTTF